MKKQPATKPFKKRILIAAPVLLIILAGLWIFVYLGINQKPDFQEYIPTKFPPGISLKSGGDFDLLRVSNQTLRQNFGLPTFNKHININFNKPNSWITEMTAGPNAVSCQEQPADAHCELLATPKGTEYILSDGTIDFQKGNTDITIFRTINEKQSRENFIDSFQPANIKGLRKNIYSYPG